jgi:hypothetical protein
MKKQIFKIAVLLLPVFGYSQMVVTDPTQAANMSTQIQATTQQIVQLDKSLEYMKKASDAVTKVSGYVRDLKELEEIAELYKEAISLSKQARQKLSKKRPATQKRIADDIINILSTLNQSITFINKIMSNNFFAMSDKERVELLREERSKILINRSALVTYTW